MQYPFTFTSFLRPEFPTRCVSQRCVSHASKIARLMVEQYNDGNEVSVLINSPERKLPRLPSPSMPARVVSREQSRKFQRDDCFRIAGKTDLSSGVAKPGLASNYNAIPSQCRRLFGTTEICQVNQRLLRFPRAFPPHISWRIFRIIDSNSRFLWRDTIVCIE